ncbi:MAG: beta-eliminating lyase-related protein [Candidatus Eisenbacteria bacterium]|uniref:Threonine aldolase n=1 Tax=Eiseniibacteriota bacterium TaxID=2212470 RepID=A0A956RNP8_UNCEI|nr:threonine aldolase [Candidatus Eisenbacteria bacterium]
MERSEIERLAARCERRLNGHRRDEQSPHRVLVRLAATIDPDLDGDLYGQGRIIADFEREIAELLGKEAALFLPSGTMAQQIALRIWSERTGRVSVGFHPTCHLELHEQKGYARLHGLHGVLIGPPHRMLTRADLDQVSEPLAALLLELPQREIGGQLPTWDELGTLLDWARERGTATHLDGARLWECGPFYQREYAEIAALFETVYVSFYKILGGITGAALAGPGEIIAEARIWQRRHGGNLVRMYPFVLAARLGLRERLPRMASYHRHAVAIADALRGEAGITVVPDPPPTNMMQVHLRGSRDRLDEASLRYAESTGRWLFHPLRPGPTPDQGFFELVVGDATLEWSPQEVRDALRQVVAE